MRKLLAASLVSFATAVGLFAVAFVQSQTGNWASGTTIVSGSITVTTGNTLVVHVQSTGAAITATVADGTNTYTSRCGRNFLTGAGGGITMFTSVNVTGGTYTPTATLSSTPADGLIIVDEYSGVNAYEAAAPGNEQGTGTSLLATITTVAANAMVVGGFGWAGAGGAFTAGSGYTERGNAAPGVRGSTEDQVFASPGAHNVDATIASSVPWTACAVSLEPTGGSTPSVIPAILNNPIRGGGIKKVNSWRFDLRR